MNQLHKGFVILAIGGLMMAACGNRTAHDVSSDSTTIVTNDAENMKVGTDSLKIDTISFSKKEEIYDLQLFADYPVAGDDTLVARVRAFINDYMGGVYDGPMDDAQAMIKRNGEYMYGVLMERCGDVDPEEVNGLFLYKIINKLCETNTFVTIQAITSEYTGGIHGISFESGHSFSKATGESFGYDMMKNLESRAFNQLIKTGLKQFFTKEGNDPQDMSDQDLKDELVSFGGSIDELPLPDTEPYLTKEGVTFIYQPYEISYYAAGKPQFTIPFDVAKPYLTTKAIKLFLTK